MNNNIPPFLTLAEAARLIGSRQLSPVELTRALLQRIEAIDPQVNAFLLVTAQRAMAAARAAEKSLMASSATDHHSKLLGIPLAFKDIGSYSGIC